MAAVPVQHAATLEAPSRQAPLAVVPAAARGPIRYPERDGRPLAETQAHLDQIVYLLVALQQFFATAPNVFVAADLLLYYVEGDKRKRVAPDVFIARSVRDAKAQRRTYLLWEEGAAPEVVFEITSAGSRSEDTVTKRALYKQLGVREYFLFDPLGEYLRPALQGYRLEHGAFVPLPLRPGGSLRSERLSLELHQRDGALRLFDPATAEWLRSPDEQDAARQAETAARQVEATARREAEARAQAAEAELARLRQQLAARQSTDPRSDA